MCAGCYEEYGKPAIVSGRTVWASALVRRVYKHCDLGGNLHSQLDDWNIEDDCWDEFTIYRNDSSPNQIAAERACFDAFKALTLDERASALAMYTGLLTAT
jgi:hypothetical protein